MNAYEKMREAVQELVSYWDSGVYHMGREMELKAKIRSALAEPRRNCDVYNSETCRMAYHMKGLGLMTMQEFADWLFAPYEGEVAK